MEHTKAAFSKLLRVLTLFIYSWQQFVDMFLSSYQVFEYPHKTVFRSRNIPCNMSRLILQEYFCHWCGKCSLLCSAGDKIGGGKNAKQFLEHCRKHFLNIFLTGFRSSFLSSLVHKFPLFPSSRLFLWTHTQTDTHMTLMYILHCFPIYFLKIIVHCMVLFCFE